MQGYVRAQIDDEYGKDFQICFDAYNFLEWIDTEALEHIKEKVDSNNEHLEKLNGRVRSTEISLSWIKGIGVTFAFVISTLLTYFHKYK